MLLEEVFPHAGDPLALVLNLFEARIQVGDAPDVGKHRGVLKIRPKALDQCAAEFRRLAEVIHVHHLGAIEQETTRVGGELDGFATKGCLLFRSFDHEGAIDPVAPGAHMRAAEFRLAVAGRVDYDGVVSLAFRVEHETPESLILTIALGDDFDGEFQRRPATISGTFRQILPGSVIQWRLVGSIQERGSVRFLLRLPRLWPFVTRSACCW